MAIKNKYLALIFRVLALGLGIFTCYILFTTDATADNPARSFIYFSTEVALLGVGVLFAEVVTTIIGIAKGSQGLAPGIYEPLYLATIIYAVGGSLLYAVLSPLFSYNYFPDGKILYTVLGQIAFPGALFLDYLLFGEKGTVKWRHLGYFSLYPAIYFGYVMVVHYVSEETFFPYPFLDANTFVNDVSNHAFSGNTGWNGVFLSTAIIFIGIIAFAALMIFLNNLYSGKYFKKKEDPYR